MGAASGQFSTTVALGVLGLTADASWSEIHQSFRRQIRDCHPDVAGDTPQATEESARLNQAFEVLANATERGAKPLPAPEPEPELVSDGSASYDGTVSYNDTASYDGSGSAMEPVVVLNAPPGDVFVHLLDAAHEFGDVSYVSPDEGLIQVLVNPQNAARYQLLISLLSTDHRAPRVSFSMDSLTLEPAPPIAQVVDAFSELLAQGF